MEKTKDQGTQIKGESLQQLLFLDIYTLQPKVWKVMKDLPDKVLCSDNNTNFGDGRGAGYFDVCMFTLIC